MRANRFAFPTHAPGELAVARWVKTPRGRRAPGLKTLRVGSCGGKSLLAPLGGLPSAALAHAQASGARLGYGSRPARTPATRRAKAHAQALRYGSRRPLHLRNLCNQPVKPYCTDCAVHGRAPGASTQDGGRRLDFRIVSAPTFDTASTRGTEPQKRHCTKK